MLFYLVDCMFDLLLCAAIVSLSTFPIFHLLVTGYSTFFDNFHLPQCIWKMNAYLQTYVLPHARGKIDFQKHYTIPFLLAFLTLSLYSSDLLSCSIPEFVVVISLFHKFIMND